MTHRIITGDVFDVLATLDPSSFDAVFCDPPYGFPGGFMGRQWDNLGKGAKLSAFHEAWLSAALPALKPGANVVAASGSRVFHRLACGAEDAGLDILPLFAWINGQAMAQGTDISKLIDKARNDDQRHVTAFVAAARDHAGKTNRDIDEHFGTNGMAGHWTSTASQPATPSPEQWAALKNILGFGDSMDSEVWRLNGRKGQPGEDWEKREKVGEAHRIRRSSPSTVAGESAGAFDITAPATDAAKLWEGYATRLKDSVCPWLMARVPFDGPSYRNALEHGVAGFDIEAGRVPTDGRPAVDRQVGSADKSILFGAGKSASALSAGTTTQGRYPANLALDFEATEELGWQSGAVHSGGATTRPRRASNRVVFGQHSGGMVVPHGDEGTAARFFHQFRYNPKAGPGERMKGCEGFFWRVNQDNPLGFDRIHIDEWHAMDHRPGCRPALKGTYRRNKAGMKGTDGRRRGTTYGQPTPLNGQDAGGFPLAALLGVEPLPGGCVDGCQHRLRYQGSIHPTLKPIALCQYLARLILPPPRPDGKPRRLLVPFSGTGSEMIGALLAGWDEVIGIEVEPVYVELAEARIRAWVTDGEQAADQVSLFEGSP